MTLVMELLPLCFKEKLGSKPPTICEMDGGFTFCYFFRLRSRPNWTAASTKVAIMTTVEITSNADMIPPPPLLHSVRG